MRDGGNRNAFQFIAMAGKIYLAPHLSTEELGRRYKAASDGIERSHLQIIWLLSQDHAAKYVAAVTGYSPSRGSDITWRYSATSRGATMTTAHRGSATGGTTIPAQHRFSTPPGRSSCAEW